MRVVLTLLKVVVVGMTALEEVGVVIFLLEAMVVLKVVAVAMTVLEEVVVVSVTFLEEVVVPEEVVANVSVVAVVAVVAGIECEKANDGVEKDSQMGLNRTGLH